MVKERFIAFLDILGFSDIVLNNDLEFVLKKFEMIGGFLGPYAESLGDCFNPNDPTYPRNKKCSLFSFSDTFVLCSSDTTPESLNNIIISTFIIARGLFASGLPVRGAITKGEADYIPNSNHLIGKAIINAARLEKQQNWFGVIVSPEVISIDNKTDILSDSVSQVLTAYSVPFKNGTKITCLVINWRLNLVVTAGTKSLLPKPIDISSTNKIENTLKFANYIKVTKQAYKKLSENWQQRFYVAETPPTRTPPKHGDEY